MNFKDKWQKQFEAKKSFLCVGLDTDLALIPERFRKEKNPPSLYGSGAGSTGVSIGPSLAYPERPSGCRYSALSAKKNHPDPPKRRSWKKAL